MRTIVDAITIISYLTLCGAYVGVIISIALYVMGVIDEIDLNNGGRQLRRPIKLIKEMWYYIAVREK